MTPTPTAPRTLPQPGTTLGEHYLLGEVIGTGGFGTVFSARCLRLQREVALKVIDPSTSRARDLIARRFAREIDLVRRLEHPNIVRLYDAGRTDAGLLWMAMERVRGEELRVLLEREGRLEPHRARHIILQVLSALAEAHDQGIVHRDLKPANIMLTRRGTDRDIVKLLDFGIAKAFGAHEDAGIQDVTQREGVAAGTPRYMPPEIALRERQGPHGDVYAAGLILAEMLQGHQAALGSGAFEVVARHVKGDLAIDDVLRDSDLGAVIARATCVDWRARYPTAHELHRALAAVSFDLQPSDRPSDGDRPRIDTIEDLCKRLSERADGVIDEVEVVDDEVYARQTREIDTASATALLTARADDIHTRDLHFHSSDAPLPPAPRSRRRIGLALLGALAVLGALAIGPNLTRIDAYRGDAERAWANASTPHGDAHSPARATAQPVPAAPASAAPQAAPALAVAAEPAPAAQVEPAAPQDEAVVSWRITSAPTGATVLLDGEAACDTPCTLSLLRTDQEREVLLQLERHRDARQRMLPTSDGVLHITLAPLRRGPVGAQVLAPVPAPLPPSHVRAVDDVDLPE